MWECLFLISDLGGELKNVSFSDFNPVACACDPTYTLPTYAEWSVYRSEL